MVRILCVSKISPSAPSGVVTYYKKLAEFFNNDKDVNIDLITVDSVSSAEKKVAGLVRRFIYFLSFGNKRIIKLSIDTNLKCLLAFALHKRKNNKYDIIHAQDISSGYITKLFLNNNIPLILTCHFNDNPVEEDLLLYKFPKNDKGYLVNFYKQRFAAVDKFIFVSKYSYKKSKHLLQDNSDVEVIYNGANFTAFNEERRGDGMLQIVNVGFVEERKNQKILLSLAKELIKRNVTGFHITLVGDGDDLPLIKDLVENEGLNNYFSFPGWTSKVVTYLKKSNLYIHTAINDNCPYSIIEAISKGLPVIAFNVGGIPEIITTDFLFKVNDFSSMASFIVSHKNDLVKIAEQQFNSISRTFSESYQFEATKKVYMSFESKSGVAATKDLHNYSIDNYRGA
jgi:glycosyltransferase involved in cell wall biosynthesis